MGAHSSMVRKNNRFLLTFPWQCPANAPPSSGTAECSEPPAKQAACQDVTSGRSGRKESGSSKSAFQQQKADVEGADSHPCGLAVRRLKPWPSNSPVSCCKNSFWVLTTERIDTRKKSTFTSTGSFRFILGRMYVCSLS